MSKISSGENQDISRQELADIRSLGDFDLIMLLSEIHDHGWPIARKLLPDIMKAKAMMEERSK